MTPELYNELCTYIGVLMHQHEFENDWIAKDKILEKINAANILLDIDIKGMTWYEKLAESLNEIKKK